ncbi:MAG TPA: CDP-alcohol phosphatidyltransferase family protein [Saprospiraceae bacterium]|nr:CDP-alcohol phosphatidyltransferase family protein [Saprospiraceae bacterium]
MNESISYWTLGHAILMLMAIIVAIICDASYVLIWAVSFSISVLIIITYPIWIQLHPVGGFANHVTFARFVLLTLALSLQNILNPFVVAAMIVVVMIADGIDGYLSRRLHQSTEFGAVFDMEVDAFLALALTFLIWKEHRAAFWILGAGLLRYMFVILYRIIRWHKRRHPVIRKAKVLAVLFFISLLTPLVIEWYAARWIVAAGCTLVTYSFVKEFYLTSKEHKY